MSLVGVAGGALHSFHLADFSAAGALLVLLGPHLLEHVHLENPKLDVIAPQVELPAQQRTGLLDQDSEGPKLSGGNGLVQLEVLLGKFGRLEDFLDFLRVKIGLGGVELRVPQEAQVFVVFDHGRQLEIILVCHYLVAEHGRLLDLVVVPLCKQGDVAQHQKQGAPHAAGWRTGGEDWAGPEILEGLGGMGRPFLA
jgi:hypothetical protein